MNEDLHTSTRRRGRPARLTDRERLEDARLAEKQAAERRQALENRVQEAERAADTRRKVILGGALIARAAHDQKGADMLIDLIKNLARPQDRGPFEGWDPPAPSSGTHEATINHADVAPSVPASPPASSLFDSGQWAREDHRHG